MKGKVETEVTYTVETCWQDPETGEERIETAEAASYGEAHRIATDAHRPDRRNVSSMIRMRTVSTEIVAYNL